MASKQGLDARCADHTKMQHATQEESLRAGKATTQQPEHLRHSARPARTPKGRGRRTKSTCRGRDPGPAVLQPAPDSTPEKLLQQLHAELQRA